MLYKLMTGKYTREKYCDMKGCEAVVSVQLSRKEEKGIVRVLSAHAG